jgi:glycosyltransferase involved in cell wall biosynthesis
MSRILWFSAKPTIPSGYGTQTRLLVPYLAKYHEVAIACHAGLFGAVEENRGVRLYPHSNFPGKYCMDLIESHCQHFKPDVVVSWVDSFILEPSVISKLPWISWVPCDSEPLMAKNIIPLKACKKIIAPTEWSKQSIEMTGLKVDTVIPCAYDAKQFYSMTESREEIRKTLSKVINVEIGNKFLVNVVSANSSYRKNFPAIFSAWKLFSKGKKDVMLYIHTDPSGYFFQGDDLHLMMKTMGVDMSTVFFPPQWEYVTGAIGENFLNLLYNASDVHLNTCYGEGFGLPILEAQATGCPAIVPAFGAAQEIALDKELICHFGNMEYTLPGGMQFKVSSQDVASKLSMLWIETNRYDYQYPRKALAEKTRKYVIENVIKHWNSFLNNCLK